MVSLFDGRWGILKAEKSRDFAYLPKQCNTHITHITHFTHITHITHFTQKDTGDTLWHLVKLSLRL